MSKNDRKIALKKKANMSLIQAEIKKSLATMRKKGIQGGPFLLPNRFEGEASIKDEVLCFRHGPLFYILDYTKATPKGCFLVLTRRVGDNEDEKLAKMDYYDPLRDYQTIYKEVQNFAGGRQSVIETMFDPTREKRPGPWVDLALEILASLQASIRVHMADEEIEKWRAFEDAKVTGNSYLNRRLELLPKTYAIP